MVMAYRGGGGDDRWKELQGIIGDPGKVDEAALTDPELAQRLSAYQEMGSFKPEFNKRKLARSLQERLAGNGLSPQYAERIGHAIADNAAKTGQFDPSVINSAEFGNPFHTNALQDVLNLTRQEFGQGGYNVGRGDFSGDVKRLSDLTTQRGNRAKAQTDVNDLITNLPQELMRGRQHLFQGEADSANQYYNDYLAPEVMQGLNSRGLLYSGDLESELSRTAGDVQGSLENAYTNQQSQDDAFFQNAAYQQTFMNEIQAGNDVTGQIANQRNQASQNQNMSFQRTQADLSRQFQALLQQKQQTRQIQAQDAQYRRQQEANKPNQWQALGQAVGTVGGAVVGNMVAPGIGGYIGAGVGGQLGGAGGSAIPGRLNT